MAECVFKTKQELKEAILFEREQYKSLIKPLCKNYFFAVLERHPLVSIMKWQSASRMFDWYSSQPRTICNLFPYLYWLRKSNKLASKIGVEINTKNIGKGLILYHTGATVINGGSVIGQNLRLHGNNCIGNAGPHNLKCPQIGDNVVIGVGAKLFGNITIADEVKIGAGSVVNKSITEKGVLVIGVPGSIKNKL